jgi:type II restriction enzyme
MMRLTPSNLVHAINQLPNQVWFDYVNDRTRTKVQYVQKRGPEGPIVIRRRVSNGNIDELSISTEMLWRAANAIVPNTPINFERVFGSSYNTRSALEALLVHTPQFYWCKPGRIELIRDSAKIKSGHKHIIWLPNKLHENGVMCQTNDVEAISELPIQLVAYDALVDVADTESESLPIDVKRRHLQIQIALVEIGAKLGFRTWVAQNDRGYKYGQKTIGNLDGVINRLSDERVMASYQEAIDAAKLIDCIWFKNGRLMPAVMEVEHSTGVTSGLNRMQKFQKLGPALQDVRWVIVAADEDRNDVLRKANDPQFSSLETRYFSYSAVEELYSLCRRRGLSNHSVNEKFLDCFMESCRQH